MGDLRHHRPIREPSGERRRTRGVDEEATPAPPRPGPPFPFRRRPASDAEREAGTKKPPLPHRSRALTSYPVVRYIGRDDAARTVAGWQHWLDAVAGWVGGGGLPA